MIPTVPNCRSFLLFVCEGWWTRGGGLAAAAICKLFPTWKHGIRQKAALRCGLGGRNYVGSIRYHSPALLQRGPSD